MYVVEISASIASVIKSQMAGIYFYIDFCIYVTYVFI
jgi:hypothetical protein